MKRLVFASLLVVIVLATASCAAPAAPVAPAAPAATSASAPEASAPAAAAGQEYTLAEGDTLATVAADQLGNQDWLWAVYGLTNAKYIEDKSFTQITNPDDVPVGSKVWIPTTEDAQAFMEKFDPADPDIHMLFPAPPTGQLLVGNWWTSGGEFAGINELYEMYREQFPGVDLVHAGIAGGGGVNFQAANLTKLQSGDPFDVFQTHAGREIALYAPAQYLTPLEDLLEETEGSVVPQDVKDLLEYEGHIYSIPLNIHRANVLWVNKTLMAENGVESPTTFDEFFEVAETLKAAGIIPLAMGGSGKIEGPQAFETVLLGTMGPDGMIGLANGTASWKDPRVAEALETYKRMLTYTNQDRDSLSWDQAVELVITGKAAMNIMGDWADGEFVFAGKTAEEYEGIPAPNNEGSFLLVSDSFALPLEAPNMEHAMNWLRLIATKEAQEAFNKNKGSICSRTDCDYSEFDEYLKSSAEDFSTSRIVPGIVYAGAALEPDWRQAFIDTIVKFQADGDVTAAQNALVQAAIDAGYPDQ